MKKVLGSRRDQGQGWDYSNNLSHIGSNVFDNKLLILANLTAFNIWPQLTIIKPERTLTTKYNHSMICNENLNTGNNALDAYIHQLCLVPMLNQWEDVNLLKCS